MRARYNVYTPRAPKTVDGVQPRAVAVAEFPLGRARARAGDGCQCRQTVITRLTPLTRHLHNKLSAAAAAAARRIYINVCTRLQAHALLY